VGRRGRQSSLGVRIARPAILRVWHTPLPCTRRRAAPRAWLHLGPSARGRAQGHQRGHGVGAARPAGPRARHLAGRILRRGWRRGRGPPAACVAVPPAAPAGRRCGPPPPRMRGCLRLGPGVKANPTPIGCATTHSDWRGGRRLGCPCHDYQVRKLPAAVSRRRCEVGQAWGAGARRAGGGGAARAPTGPGCRRQACASAAARWPRCRPRSWPRSTACTWAPPGSRSSLKRRQRRRPAGRQRARPRSRRRCTACAGAGSRRARRVPRCAGLGLG